MDHRHAYERRLQFNHFFNNQRTWFEIQMIPPEKTPEGWVNDGKVRLSIGQDRELKGSFLLSIDEICRLVASLETTVAEHELAKAKLWKDQAE
ncbi:MAG: hypothetical protein ACFFEF_13630 [Candidatus Thorarchaeota archaeon]